MTVGFCAQLRSGNCSGGRLRGLSKMTAADTADVAAAHGAQTESGMIRALVRLLVLIGFGAFLILLVILPLGLRYGAESLELPGSTLAARLAAAGLWPAFLLEMVLRMVAAVTATWGLF